MKRIAAHAVALGTLCLAASSAGMIYYKSFSDSKKDTIRVATAPPHPSPPPQVVPAAAEQAPIAPPQTVAEVEGSEGWETIAKSVHNRRGMLEDDHVVPYEAAYAAFKRSYSKHREALLAPEEVIWYRKMIQQVTEEATMPRIMLAIIDNPPKEFMVDHKAKTEAQNLVALKYEAQRIEEATAKMEQLSENLSALRGMIKTQEKRAKEIK